MQITGKKLAYATWAIAAIYLINALVNAGSGAVWVITQLAAIVLQCFLGYAMFREKNDKVTMVIVIIFAVLSFSIPVGILVVLMLCRRYAKKINFVQKCWFVPAAISGIVSIVNLVRVLEYASYYPAGRLLLTVLIYIVNILTYLILGYWLVKELDIVDKGTRIKASQTAYFDDLLSRGVITKEEYDEKISSIKEGK